MGVYDNLNNSSSTFSFVNNTGSPIYVGQPITQDMIIIPELKCKCPNPKHTNGCSIEPEGEYCVFCAKGCVKRVQAIHVRFLK